MPDWEREDLVANMIDLLGQCERDVQERAVDLFSRCDADYGARVAAGIGVPAPTAAGVSG
jgi:catalase